MARTKRAFDLAAYANPLAGVSDLDRREVRDIELARIRGNEGNFYSVEGVDELADSIALNGLLQPLLVVPDGEGSYRLISGHRRCKALRQLREETGDGRWDRAPCIVLPDPRDKDREELMLIHANSTGRVLSGAELQTQAARLREILCRMREAGVELPGRVRDMVAEQLQVSASRIARLDAISSRLAVPGMIRAWQEGALGESAAYEISQLPVEEQYRLLDRIVDEGLPYGRVDLKTVRQAKEGAGRPTKQEIALALEELGLDDGGGETALRRALVARAGLRQRMSNTASRPGDGLRDYADALRLRLRNAGSNAGGVSWRGDNSGITFDDPVRLRMTWASAAEALAANALMGEPGGRR